MIALRTNQGPRALCCHGGHDGDGAGNPLRSPTRMRRPTSRVVFAGRPLERGPTFAATRNCLLTSLMITAPSLCQTSLRAEIRRSSVGGSEAPREPAPAQCPKALCCCCRNETSSLSIRRTMFVGRCSQLRPWAHPEPLLIVR